MIAPAANGSGGLDGRDWSDPAPSAGVLGAPLLLVLAAAACWLVFLRPVPVTNAVAGGFSAKRAVDELGLIAQEPRPVGSEHHARVRRWIGTEIRALGQTPVLQAGRSGDTTLTNILVRLTGSDSSGAVLFVCHYDTRPETPGASDDGVSVITLLQLLDILPRLGTLENDLIFLFTDGEELGLQGARLFAEQHPWMADVACVVNLEAIGNDGPLVLFQTGPGSGRLIERYAAVAPHPVATSLAPAVYDRLPNDTDFTVFRERRLPGLNFALVGGGAAYHSPHDTPGAIDPSSVQHLGDTALALARELGRFDFDGLERVDLAYFDLLSQRLLVYGPTTSRVVTGVALAAIALAFVLAGRGNGPSFVARLIGALAFPAFAALAALAALALWAGLDLAVSVIAGSRGGGSDLVSSSCTLGGLGALAAFATVAAIDRLHVLRRGRAYALAFGVGGLVPWAAVLLALSSFDANAPAQLAVAVASAAVGCAAGARSGVVTFATALLAVVLVAPVACLTFHVLSAEPWKAVLVGAVGASAATGLAAPHLAGTRHGPQMRTLLGLSGVALLAAGAWLRAHGS